MNDTASHLVHTHAFHKQYHALQSCVEDLGRGVLGEGVIEMGRAEEPTEPEIEDSSNIKARRTNKMHSMKRADIWPPDIWPPDIWPPDTFRPGSVPPFPPSHL